MAGKGKAGSKAKRSFLEVRDVTKKFGDFVALQDITLDIHEGELVCFLGPSGCGKTTLLRAIAGLDFQSAGRIYQNGWDISDVPPADRDFGIVFQSYALFPNLTVARNISYGLVSRRMDRGAIKARGEELLDLVGMPGSEAKFPAALSGGQQQRVALARALAKSPGILLLDEPLSALDAKVRVHLRHEIKELQRRLGVTTVMVTHDQEEALSMADRIVVMNHGVIEQVGAPIEIYREPHSLFVADFIGAMNQLEGTASCAESAILNSKRMTCQPHGLKAGSKGVLSIRPEDVIPHSEAKRSRGGKEVVAEPGNAFKVEISEMEFLGSFWRSRLAGGPINENSEFIADFSINAVRRMGLSEGQAITIELPSKRLRFFAA